jgi:hypothetical protein
VKPLVSLFHVHLQERIPSVGNRGDSVSGGGGIPSGGRGGFRQGRGYSVGGTGGFRRGRRGILLGGRGDSVVKGGGFCRERKMIPHEKNGDSVGKGNGKEEYSVVGRWVIPLEEEGHSVVGEGGLN